jgi:hypothetical protein
MLHLQSSGSWLPDGACACGANSNSEVGSVLATACRCVAGFTGPDGGACSACAAGKFKAAAGSAACTACDAGKYLAGSGATTAGACVACVAGTYSATVGAAGVETCIACSEGSFSTVVGAACIPFMSVFSCSDNVPAFLLFSKSKAS